MDEAIEIYHNILEDWPDYEYRCGIQAAIAWCYEKMRDTGEVPKEEINPIIEEAYKAVLENYAGCMASKSIAYNLAGMMLEKGNKAEAIVYYRKFLELADPNMPNSNAGCLAKAQDGRVAGVKAKIAEIEGFVEGGAGK